MLKDGKWSQFDQPRAIYRRPANRFVAEFMGRPSNEHAPTVWSRMASSAPATSPVAWNFRDGPVTLGIRPEQIEFSNDQEPDAITLTVDVKEAIEPDTLLIFQNRGASVTLRTQRHCDAIEPGKPVSLRFPKEAVHYFDVAQGSD